MSTGTPSPWPRYVLCVLLGLGVSVACAVLSATQDAVPEDRFIEVNGARLHYLDWGGDKPMILLVHGITTTARDFGPIAPALSQDYRVMAVTRRGHGASDAAPDSFSVDLNVDDLAGFIQAFSDKPVVLVGMSHGGLEIPRVARRYPHLVRALVFLDGVYDWTDLAGFPPVPGFDVDLDSVYSSFDELDQLHSGLFPEFWSEDFRRRLHSQVVVRSDGRIAWRLRPASPAFAGYVKLWSEWDREDLQAIAVPVLAFRAHQEGYWIQSLTRRGFSTDDVVAAKVAARFDDAIKDRGLQWLKSAVPDAEVIDLEATHHLVHWHRPEAVISGILDFLRRRLRD